MPKSDNRRDANKDETPTLVTSAEKKFPPDVERVWKKWSGNVRDVDTRTKALLRAAFEAGVDASKPGH